MGRMKDLLITIYGGGDEAVEAAKQIAGLSEIVPQDDEPLWIPVEERLPEPWVSVLVAVHEYVLAGRVDTGGVWRDCRDETQGGVTHWQPLPEPPEVK